MLIVYFGQQPVYGKDVSLYTLRNPCNRFDPTLSFQQNEHHISKHGQYDIN